MIRFIFVTLPVLTLLLLYIKLELKNIFSMSKSFFSLRTVRSIKSVYFCYKYNFFKYCLPFLVWITLRLFSLGLFLNTVGWLYFLVAARYSVNIYDPPPPLLIAYVGKCDANILVYQLVPAVNKKRGRISRRVMMYL